MRRFIVGAESAGQRADVFVSAKFPEYTRSSLSGLFEKSQVSVNGKYIKPGVKLRSSDKVAVDDELLRTEPKDINLPVIYEDEEVIVIDKPAGMLTHSKGALNLEPTVASFIRKKLSDKSMTGNRAGIVHRLDRHTSGIIICAKNFDSLKYLQKQFSARKVEKTYLAVVEGVPSPPEAIIDAPLARNPRKPQTFMVSIDGKPARTIYKLLKILNESSNFSLLEIKPETGRTHQIRVHLAYIGHPVAGDSVYGHDAERMKLHAYKLKLRLPNGSLKTFISNPPISFEEV